MSFLYPGKHTELFEDGSVPLNRAGTGCSPGGNPFLSEPGLRRMSPLNLQPELCILSIELDYWGLGGHTEALDTNTNGQDRRHG